MSALSSGARVEPSAKPVASGVSEPEPGRPPVASTITIPRGSNLLSAASYTGTTLAPAFGALTPYLSPLTGPTGPLHDLQIILGAGFSDDGDGTYARGLVEAVRMSIVVGTASVAHTFGRAYSAAFFDSVWIFS